jgi:hypothetical protein
MARPQKISSWWNKKNKNQIKYEQIKKQLFPVIIAAMWQVFRLCAPGMRKLQSTTLHDQRSVCQKLCVLVCRTSCSSSFVCVPGSAFCHYSSRVYHAFRAAKGLCKICLYRKERWAVCYVERLESLSGFARNDGSFGMFQCSNALVVEPCRFSRQRVWRC